MISSDGSTRSDNEMLCEHKPQIKQKRALSGCFNADFHDHCPYIHTRQLYISSPTVCGMNGYSVLIFITAETFADTGKVENSSPNATPTGLTLEHSSPPVCGFSIPQLRAMMIAEASPVAASGGERLGMPYQP